MSADSALARGWRRLSSFAQPATARPPDTVCPDCGSTDFWTLGAVRTCERCGLPRVTT